VLDGLCGLYDTVVRDRRLVRPTSLLARLLWRWERSALRLADRIVTDTASNAHSLIEDYGLREDRVFTAPLGIDEELWIRRPLPEDTTPFRVAFWCTFIPLHGAEVVARAASSLQGASVPIQFEVIGTGQEAAGFRELVDELGLTNIHWRNEIVPMEALVDLAERSHCCLGVFGATEKAGRVVPYKVYQALASARPVITGDTPTMRSVLVDGESALLVPPGDHSALASSIARLASDRLLCERLAHAGRRAYERLLSNQVATATLDRELEQVARRARSSGRVNTAP
jgi:glycosyltransferase involved in cell wall biosynthesis